MVERNKLAHGTFFFTHDKLISDFAILNRGVLILYFITCFDLERLINFDGRVNFENVKLWQF